jgi:hypothetical protein
MDTRKISLGRKVSLAMFFVGMVAFAVCAGEHEVGYLFAALLMFGGLAFFTFTEAFLVQSSRHTKIGMWSARLFLVPLVVTVLWVVGQLLVVAS